jgi:hypothetical protein
MLRALLLTSMLALTALVALAAPASADMVCAVDGNRGGAVCYDADRAFFCTLVTNTGGEQVCVRHINLDDLWCPFERPILQCVI